jgi:hypothetical protein
MHVVRSLYEDEDVRTAHGFGPPPPGSCCCYERLPTTQFDHRLARSTLMHGLTRSKLMQAVFSPRSDCPCPAPSGTAPGTARPAVLPTLVRTPRRWPSTAPDAAPAPPSRSPGIINPAGRVVAGAVVDGPPERCARRDSLVLCALHAR